MAGEGVVEGGMGVLERARAVLLQWLLLLLLQPLLVVVVGSIADCLEDGNLG